jgi:hypothetical protein
MGVIRPYIPMCDAHAAARKNTARLIHSHNWAIGYELCEDAPAAVEATELVCRLTIRFILPTQNSEEAQN